MTRRSLTILAMTASLHVLAGTPFCHTPDGSGRPLQYEAKDGGCYTLNGTNRFTRALYGGYTARVY